MFALAHKLSLPLCGVRFPHSVKSFPVPGPPFLSTLIHFLQTDEQILPRRNLKRWQGLGVGHLQSLICLKATGASMLGRFCVLVWTYTHASKHAGPLRNESNFICGLLSMRTLRISGFNLYFSRVDYGNYS